LKSRETHCIGVTESSNIILSILGIEIRIIIYPRVVPKYSLGVILTPRGVPQIPGPPKHQYPRLKYHNLQPPQTNNAIRSRKYDPPYTM